MKNSMHSGFRVILPLLAAILLAASLDAQTSRKSRPRRQISWVNHTFSFIGAFSGGGRSISAPAADSGLKLFWAGAGSAEGGRAASGKALVEAMKTGGIRAHWVEVPGTAHEWQTWRVCLRDFAALLFRE